MNARYSTAALAEAAEAVGWYLSRPNGGKQLADRFVDELTRVEQLAVERPLAWPTTADDQGTGATRDRG